MLYQMIVGAWPLELDTADDEGCLSFAGRLAGWQKKALREAKLRTDWTTPDEGYETVARDFLFRLFSPGNPFRALAGSFVDRIAQAGAVNGLVQSALKMTVPGMPDFYQGTEFWDLSLVDPDNRRPVDYGTRRAALATEQGPETLLPQWRDGRVKQWMARMILRLRQDAPQIFACGDYRPLYAKGPLRDRIVAFARTHAGSTVIVIAPRLVQGLLRSGDELRLQPAALRGSILLMPEQLRGHRMQSLLGNGAFEEVAAEIPVGQLLADFPVAILHSVGSA
jgi:maltooligosyltrehalose synthase